VAWEGFRLATSSVEEGLDFACNLLSDLLAERVNAFPGEAPALLRDLALYVSLRYAGELGLALELLASLGHSSHAVGQRAAHFWAQLRWIAERTLTPEEQHSLSLPTISGPGMRGSFH
jgi:hypothetical protein